MSTAPSPSNNSWQMAPSQPAHPSYEAAEEPGLQVRSMGLKVHYTFDRDGQVHCLARWPHTLQIQTIPLDEKNNIGVVDLRTCLQAIAQCSPEIVNQQENDYTVYAHDYSEPDVPLVGQGMLSWGLDVNNDPHSQQLLTGRVTRNLLGIFANGIRETLEVKLKLTPVTRMNRVEGSSGVDQAMTRSAPTPSETTEWNAFLQSNPTLGHSANVAPMPSPSLRPAQLSNSMPENRAMESVSQLQYQRPPSRPSSIPPRPGSIPPRAGSIPPRTGSIPPKGNPPLDAAPSPAYVPEPSQDKAAKPASRPTSRARHRSKPPTGRPRGRPRKKPTEAGSTSAAEEATDADEGPQKKRAKLTRADSNIMAPFGSASDSLRVAASTSGSLRNMRPVGSMVDASGSNHLQEVPRAPTPVPEAPLLQKQPRRMAPTNPMRRESLSFEPEGSAYQPRFSHLNRQMSISHDARSPTESIAQSPDQYYTPEDSPGDLGSSPPVPRTSAYIRSSPAPSSPILPTLPLPISHLDSGFMSGGIDDLFDEEELQREVAKQLQLQNGGDILSLPPLPPVTRPIAGPRSSGNSRRGSVSQREIQNQVPPQPQQQQQQQPPSQPPQPQPQSNFPFHVVNPGPPELLPTTSIFRPPAQGKAARSRLKGRVGSVSNIPASLPTAPRLSRSNTAPPVAMFEPSSLQQQEPIASQERAGSEIAQQNLPGPYMTPAEDSTVSRGASADLDVDMDAHLSALRSHTEEPLDHANEIAAPMPVPEHQQSSQIFTQPTLPGVPTAMPTTSSALTLPALPTSRPGSRGLSIAPVPASDPAPQTILSLPQAPAPFSEAACPPSDLEPRYNKNAVKKQSIKERLENAIQRGEMPPFCNNCGAIETPTWRKIWTQDHDGVPGFHEFSDKPGQVTTIDVLERNAAGQPSKHRLVKKNLGPMDPKSDWKESLLCNPCGIWLTKFKCHRPADRWDKDAARLNQPRRKRDNRGSNSRSKKASSRADGLTTLTSEAYFPTDPLGPPDQESANEEEAQGYFDQPRRQSAASLEGAIDQSQMDQSRNYNESLNVSPKQYGPGSTHSRGSGTANSPIAVEEDDLGATRRLLFPSPRKDGEPKILGELAVNVVQTSPNFQQVKATAMSKENQKMGFERPATPVAPEEEDELEGLFGTPVVRPSTPPSNGNPGPFKTPTRPTPSHRPITRSISRSIRGSRSAAKSPSQVLMQVERTPTKTPRSTRANTLSASASKRRTPGRAQHLHAHFALGDDIHVDHGHFDSPFTATLNQLLSEANEFTAGSPSHGLVDLDLSSLPNIDSDGVHQHLASTGALDFGNFLSTDMAMPSSPPLMRSSGGGMHFGASLSAGVDIWAQFSSVDRGDIDRL